MDIIIAAAGKGTRLRGWQPDIPKHIIPIAGRPFLYYLLDAVVAAQFHRIIVVGGYHFEKLQQAIDQYHSEATIIMVNQFTTLGEQNYGTACPLLAAKTLIQGDRFVYTMGDQLLATEDLQTMQMSTREMLLATYEHAEPQRFGVVEVTADHLVRRIIEKPSQPSSQLVNVGLYTLTKAIFPILQQLPSSRRGEFEITDALNQLAEHQPIQAVPLQGQWLDLGRPEDILALEQFLTTAQL
ncbi:MAG: NTP transferase domain-containing protein [Candidatus Kerfeldbacteria bacterium]|nr:NTP transferase domain-containing protein [Candidatus Kerfeldbacteria bacterium]